MDENRKKLYDQLSANYDMGTFNEFDSDLDNEDNQKVAWEAMGGQDGYGDFGLFQQAIARSPQAEETQQAEPAATQPITTQPDAAQPAAAPLMETQQPDWTTTASAMPSEEDADADISLPDAPNPNTPKDQSAGDREIVNKPDAVSDHAEDYSTKSVDELKSNIGVPADKDVTQHDIDSRVTYIESIADPVQKQAEYDKLMQSLNGLNRYAQAERDAERVVQSIPAEAKVAQRAESVDPAWAKRDESYGRLVRDGVDYEGKKAPSAAQRGIAKNPKRYNDNIMRVRQMSDDELRRGYATVMDSTAYRTDEERAVDAVPYIVEMNARANGGHAQTMGEEVAKEYLAQHPGLKEAYNHWKSGDEGYRSDIDKDPAAAIEVAPFAIADRVLSKIDRRINEINKSYTDEITPDPRKPIPGGVPRDPSGAQLSAMQRRIYDLAEVGNLTRMIQDAFKSYDPVLLNSYIAAFAEKENTDIPSAKKAVADIVLQKVRAEILSRMTPENNAAYASYALFGNTFAANILKAGLALMTSKPGETTIFGLEDEALANYGATHQHWWDQVVRGAVAVGTLAIDAETIGFSGPSFLSGLASRVVANRASNVFLNRLLTSTISGAVNFGTFEAQTEWVNQLKTGERNIGKIFTRFGGGLAKGAAFGTVNSAVDRLFWNARGWVVPFGEAVKILGETAVFSGIGYLETGKLTAEDLGTNFGMVMSGKVKDPVGYIRDVQARMEGKRYLPKINRISKEYAETLSQKGYSIISSILRTGRVGREQLIGLDGELNKMRSDNTVPWETLRMAEYALDGRLYPSPPATKVKVERGEDSAWTFTPTDNDGRAVGESITVKGTEAKKVLGAKFAHEIEKNNLLIKETASWDASVCREVGKAVLEYCKDNVDGDATSVYKIFMTAHAKHAAGAKLGDVEREIYFGVNARLKDVAPTDDVSVYKAESKREGYDLDRIVRKPADERSEPERIALKNYIQWLDGREVDARDLNEYDFKEWAERAPEVAAANSARIAKEFEAKADEFHAHLEDLSGKMDLGNVVVLEHVDQVADAKVRQQIERSERMGEKGVPGWYDADTDTTYVYLPHNENIEDLDRTIMHEQVTHHGLRVLKTQSYNDLCDRVWNSMSDAERDRWENYPGVKGIDDQTKRQRAAADEYIAHLAERTDPENEGLWKSFVANAKEQMRKFGIRTDRIGDAELERIIRESYRNLREGGVEFSEADAARVNGGEKATTIERGRDIAEREVMNVIIESAKYPRTKEAVIAQTPAGGKLCHNEDQDVDVRVGRNTIRHALMHGTSDEIAAMGGIDEIIAEAVKIGNIPVAEDELGHTRSVSIYYTPVSVDGRQYSARMVIKELENRGRVLDELSLYHVAMHKAKDTNSLGVNAPQASGVGVNPIGVQNRYKVKELIHSTQEGDRKLLGISSDSPALFRVRRAPNGEESNLDERQYDEVRTDNFKKWFGDWENGPENASKVVDKNGEPLVVYHQTNRKQYINRETGQNWDDLDWRERDEWDRRSDEEWNDAWEEQDFYTFDNRYARQSVEYPGFFFSPRYDEYHEYGDRTIAAYLDMKNPAIDPDIPNAGVTDTAGRDAMESLMRQGYDGVIRTEDGVPYEYIVFRPEQIKSATENNGDFSRESGDIRFRARDGRHGSAGIEEPRGEHSGHEAAVEDARRRLESDDASEFERTAARAVIKAYGGGSGDTPDGGGPRFRIRDDADMLVDMVKHNNEVARQRRDAVTDFVKAITDVDELTDSKFATALGKVMRGQRTYDQATVADITTMVKAMMDAGLLTELDNFSVKQILTKVKDSTGKNDTTAEANKLIDIMLKHQLKRGKRAFEQQLKVKGMRQDSRGVVVQGGLDYHGQRASKALKEGLSLGDLQAVNDRIDEAEQRLSDPDEVVRGNAADELDGLYIARQYYDEIKQSEIDEANIKSQLEQAQADHKNGTLSDEAYKQLRQTSNDALRELRCERVDAWARLNEQLSDRQSESAERAKQFREQQKQRQAEIQHWANSDMEGHSADPHEQETRKKSAGDKARDVSQAVLQPLGTFDKLMRYFGNSHPKGEGYLFGFVRRFMNVRDQWFKDRKADFDQMDTAARRIGAAHGARVKVKLKDGTIAPHAIKDWADVYTYINQQKPLTVTVKGKDYEITQGNATYLLAMEGQADGRMKLRTMGLTEADMDALRGQVDPMLLELSDWVVHGLLPGMRPRLNQTHIRMFGADMTDIPNYFPIRTSELARNETVNLAQQNGKIRPATITGSIIERKRNNLDLDLGADFFQVTAEHIDEMNHWNSFAEFARDLNTLLSYKRFKAQVHNLNSWRYGNGSDIWKTLEDTAAITTGDYLPKTSKADAIINGGIKGLAAANITFRLYTGLKQLLSAPVYLVQARWDDIGYAIANLKGTWQWAIENLPTFAERWQGRMAGDPILTQGEQERGSQNKKLRTASKWGFAFNAAVDATTVAIGARAIYRTKYRRYKDMGYSDEQANQKALEDASISVNETQQSGLGAFTSVIQQDRTFWSRMVTLYRNASMGYGRQLAEGLKAMRNGVSAEWRATAREKVAKKLERDGIDSAMAAKVADRLANREAMRGLALAAMFGSIAPFVWSLGQQYLGYKMAGGDDDEQEGKMLGQASTHLASGWLEGIVGGATISSLADFAYDYYHGHKKLRDYSLQHDLLSDMAEQIVGKSSGKPADAVYDIVNMIVAMSTGVNPKSIVEPTVGIIDVVQNWGGDAKLAHEVALGWCRVLNVPQTSLDQVYIDEIGLSAKDAKQLSAEEFAERWCRYKRRRGAGWMSALTSAESDAEQEGKLLKRYERMMDERFESLSDERVEQIMRESDDELLKKHAAKAYKSRIDALTDDEVQAAMVPLSDSAPQDSVDVKREGIKRAYKSEGLSYSKPNDDAKNALAYERRVDYFDIDEDKVLKGRRDALKKSVGETFERMGVKYKNGSAGWDWYADDDASASIDEIKAYYQSHKAELDEYGILSWWFGSSKGSSGYIKKGFTDGKHDPDEVMKEYREARKEVLAKTKQR